MSTDPKHTPEEADAFMKLAYEEGVELANQTMLTLVSASKDRLKGREHPTGLDVFVHACALLALKRNADMAVEEMVRRVGRMHGPKEAANFGLLLLHMEARLSRAGGTPLSADDLDLFPKAGQEAKN